MPQHARRRTKLRCSTCGHRFEGLVLHETVQGQRGAYGWVIASSDAYRDSRCPICGSQFIRPAATGSSALGGVG